MPFSPFRNPRPLLVRAAVQALILPLVFGCAAGGPPAAGVASPQADLPTLRANSDEALKLAQENRLDAQALAARVKELEGQVQILSEQLAALPSFEKVGEQERRLVTVLARLQNLEMRQANPNPNPNPKAAVSRSLSTFNPGSLPVDEAPASPAQAAATLPKPRRDEPAKGVSAPEAALYRKAFDAFYSRKYDEAIRGFGELQSAFPKGSYADNSLYWIGESQYALGNYSKAMASFRAVLEFKDTEKADDAQLKLGYCQLRLGDRKAAAAEFRKVVSLHPDSEYLERAKSELAKLESSGP